MNSILILCCFLLLVYPLTSANYLRVEEAEEGVGRRRNRFDLDQDYTRVRRRRRVARRARNLAKKKKKGNKNQGRKKCNCAPQYIINNHLINSTSSINIGDFAST